MNTKRFLTLSAIISFVLLGCNDSSDSNSASCVKDSVQCSETGRPQICTDKGWQDLPECGLDETCQLGKCSGTSCLQEGTKRCSDDDIPQVCENGMWKTQSACANETTCMSGYCVESCSTEAERRCAENTPQVCTNKLWISQKTCEANSICSNGECVESCTVDGEKRCTTDGVPQACVQGTWKDQQVCGANARCEKGECISTTPAACDAAACKTASYYRGDKCVDNGLKEVCGCEKNSDCKTGYICDTYSNVCDIKCTPEYCTAQTSGYTGNVCIEFTFDDSKYEDCGCNSNSDCKAGYSCDEFQYKCIKDCNPNECKAQTTDYSGNVCITYKEEDTGEGYTYCGCNSQSDCKSGYTCNLEFNFCSKSSNTDVCSVDTCKAASEATYKGDACVMQSKGTDCGCSKQEDCREGYFCNYQDICIIDKDISECATDNDCKIKTGDNYWGDRCLVNYYDGGSDTYCGCKSSKDCKTNYACDLTYNECTYVGNTEEYQCSAALCRTMEGDDYSGDTCINFYGLITCGCASNADCRDGMVCDSEYHYCD